MSYLHENRNDFVSFISEAARVLHIPEIIVEKDYYVTLMLNELHKIEPDMIFKGGTSLSKCYGIINRFSEDIDLNLASGTGRASENKRVRFSKEIRECAANIGLTPKNFSEENPLRYKNRFVRYIYDYSPIFAAGFIKPQIEIETAMFTPSIPAEERPVDSLASKYLYSIGESDMAEEMGLSGFSVMAQSLVRTYIDKLFAVADYYLDDRVDKHSRHLYDLYKLSKEIDLKKIPTEFIAYVRDVRAEYTTSKTSSPEYDLPEVLQEIINKDVYRDDYNSVTVNMIFDDVDYQAAEKSLQDNIDIMRTMGIFRAQDPDIFKSVGYKDRYPQDKIDAYMSAHKKSTELTVITGIPDAGKRDEAERIADRSFGTVIISPQAIREYRKDNGMECSNEAIYDEVYRQIRKSIIQGRNTILTAVCTDHIARAHILEAVSGLPDVMKNIVTIYKDPGSIQSDEPKEKLIYLADKLHRNKPDRSEGWDSIREFGKDINIADRYKIPDREESKDWDKLVL